MTATTSLRSLALGIVLAASPRAAWSFVVGDFVFPKTTPAPIKVGETVAKEVQITDYLEVKKVEGGWLWVECKNLMAPGDPGTNGWVAANSVDDLETQIRYFAGKAAENNNAAGYFFAGAVASLAPDEAHQRTALNYLTRAIELEPGTDYHYQRRASCWMMLGNYDASLKDLQEAARIDPTNATVASLIVTVEQLRASGAGGAPQAPTGGAPPVASPAETGGGTAAQAPATVAPDPRVQAGLTEAGLKFEVAPNGNFKVGFNSPSERRQFVFVDSRTEKLGDFEIRKVWSLIGQAEEQSFPQSTADQLLRAGSTRKIGAVEVTTINGKPTAYYTAKVPADLSGPRLAEIVRGMANVSDDLERSLFGGDRY